MRTQKYKVSIILPEDKVNTHWEKLVEALKRFGKIILADAVTKVVTIMSELNFLTLTGRVKDAVKGIYFGADVSCSPA